MGGVGGIRYERWRGGGCGCAPTQYAVSIISRKTAEGRRTTAKSRVADAAEWDWGLGTTRLDLGRPDV